MASQEYDRRVENLIHTLESFFTSTELAEARDFVARGTPWQGLYSLAWIIERRGVSVPHEAKKRIAHLVEAFVDRESSTAGEKMTDRRPNIASSVILIARG